MYKISVSPEKNILQAQTSNSTGAVMKQTFSGENKAQCVSAYEPYINSLLQVEEAVAVLQAHQAKEQAAAKKE